MDILFNLSQNSEEYADLYKTLESNMIREPEDGYVKLQEACRMLEENPIVDFIVAHRAKCAKQLESQKQINVNYIKAGDAKKMQEFSESLKKIGTARKVLDTLVGMINYEQSQYTNFIKGVLTNEYPSHDTENVQAIIKARKLIHTKLTKFVTEVEHSYNILRDEYNNLYKNYNVLLQQIKENENLLEKQEKAIISLQGEIVLLEKRTVTVCLPKQSKKKIIRRNSF